MPVMTGLSGNEMWCLHRKGLSAGDMILGNSVCSMGILRSIGSSFRQLMGGEVTQITQLIHDGRRNSFDRLLAEAQKRGGVGVTGVSNELLMLDSNVEFLSIGSTLHQEGHTGEKVAFTSAADGLELFCQMDAGFEPRKFVFGNIAYSVGLGGTILGTLKSIRRGELEEFSRAFNDTRHLALARITEEARAAGANAVVGIKTTIAPFQGVQEMLMIGTASYHPGLPDSCRSHPVTSDLTCQEMWNLAKMGYAPLQLVLGASVYSMGWVGRVKNWVASFVRGELDDYTKLVYEARAQAIDKIRQEARRVGADDVAGIKTYVYELGHGLIEFIAMGTAVKRIPGMKTASEQLPPQAIIVDSDTFFNAVDRDASQTLNKGNKKSGGTDKKVEGGWKILRFVFDLLK